MAAEINALVFGLDRAYAIQSQLQQLTGRKVTIDCPVDSRTLFNVIAKYDRTSEKRLQIDIFELRESYAAGDMQRLSWIPGVGNPADALTREKVMPTSPITKNELQQSGNSIRGLGKCVTRA